MTAVAAGLDAVTQAPFFAEAAVPVEHWIPRSTARDIAAEARRTDRAPAVAVHVRSEVARRMHGALPVVIDDTLPASPGFEVHRAPPAA